MNKNEKPASMSMKEWMVKRTAISLSVPERIVNAVVSHQFDTALEAMKNNNSVEIYSFGKFLFNSYRAKKELKRLEIMRENTQKMYDVALPSRKNALQKRVDNLDAQINFLKNKLNHDNEEENV
jgi:nucleoid DNA-binding protein